MGKARQGVEIIHLLDSWISIKCFFSRGRWPFVACGHGAFLLAAVWLLAGNAWLVACVVIGRLLHVVMGRRC